jgi:hypothetical protein
MSDYYLYLAIVAVIVFGLIYPALRSGKHNDGGGQ